MKLLSWLKKGQISRILKNMTSAQKAAQMIFSYPRSPVFVERYGIGGLVLNQHMLRSEKGNGSLIKLYKRFSDLPFFIAIDQEGGYVNRLENINEFKDSPSALEMSERWSPKDIYKYQGKVAKFMKKIGINMNFAPCLDISSKPSSNIGKFKRSFGSSLSVVEKNAKNFAKAYKDNDIIVIGKHFPGYGDLSVDTDVLISKYDILYVEYCKNLKIYEKMKDYLDGVMISSVIYNNIDKKPAIFSKKIVNQAKIILGEDKVLIADDILSQGMKKYISIEEAVKKAIYAKIDMVMVLHALNIKRVINHITSLYENDILARNNIDNSVKRILYLKSKFLKNK